MEDKYLEPLLAHLRLDLDDEEVAWVRTVFAGYHPQIEELMSHDFAGEEVGTASYPLGSPKGPLRAPTLSLYRQSGKPYQGRQNFISRPDGVIP